MLSKPVITFVIILFIIIIFSLMIYGYLMYRKYNIAGLSYNYVTKQPLEVPPEVPIKKPMRIPPKVPPRKTIKESPKEFPKKTIKIPSKKSTKDSAKMVVYKKLTAKKLKDFFGRYIIGGTTWDKSESKKLTDIQKERLWDKNFRGKWVCWEVEVDNIRESYFDFSEKPALVLEGTSMGANVKISMANIDRIREICYSLSRGFKIAIFAQLDDNEGILTDFSLINGFPCDTMRAEELMKGNISTTEDGGSIEILSDDVESLFIYY